MTKPAPDDTLKCHLTVEEPRSLAEETAILVSNVQTNSGLKEKNEVPKITIGIKPIRKGSQKTMPELYNLEDYVESEKPIKINLDLDLYQMEKV